jgi:hypothetical protein
MDPNPTSPQPNEEPKAPEATPTAEPTPAEAPVAEAPATEPVAEPTPAPEPQPAPQPAPTPVAQPIDMNTMQGQPAPAPQPAKKSHTGLIIAIVIIALLVLPIIGLIIFGVLLVGVASTLDEDDISEIESTINEIQEETEDDTKKPTTNVENVVAGKWSCVNGATRLSNPTNFYTTLLLEDDMTFTYGLYGSLMSNNFTGTYTFEDEHKQNNSGDYNYYMVKFNTKSGYVDGKKVDLETNGGLSDMEIGITKNANGREAITMFTSSNNMYYCYDYTEDDD